MNKIGDLNEYLGRGIKCSCGRSHATNVKRIDIDRGATQRLPGHIKELGYKNLYVVADKNTWKAAGAAAAEELKKAEIPFSALVLDYDELVPDEQVIGEMQAAFPEDADLLLAVGSGTINDLAKHVSFERGIDYIIFATAPSMDGFVSVGAALMLNHVKTTLDAQGPVAVIGDTDVLAAAPMNMITAGLGDTLGKYTCLLDWKLAEIITGEYYCEEVVGMVHRALETVMSQKDKIEERSPEAIKAVTEALVLTGMAMSFVGNSRPASGCEHHVSHYWEMKFIMDGKKPILHGTKVGFGLIAALKMYHMLAEEEVDFEAAMKREHDMAAWTEKIKAAYGVAADGIIALEEKCQKNNVEARNQRLAVIQEKWPEICKTIRESLPALEEMEKLMCSLGAPINPKEIDVSLKLLEDGVLIAKEVRDRYTLLQLLWDLGLSEKYAKEMVTYFGKEQKMYFDKAKKTSKYAIGLDYGTLSVRALMVDICTGEEVATSVYEYPHGVMETKIPSGKKIPVGWALQNPQDYLDGLYATVKAVMEETQALPEEIIGIGVDFTSSTVMPVKADKTPLCLLPEFQDEPHAYVKLWKHHGGEEEAAFIDKVAIERGEKWHSLYGSKVSSEWMMPKVLETIHHAPEVYENCDRYMEAVDWIIWVLTGEESRSACGAGYKAFYHHEMGYPSKEFFKALDTRMEHVVEEKMDAPIKGVGEKAGHLTEVIAKELGLCPGTPVGTGIIDAHASVVGAGISGPGTMMIIVGTSSCHMILSETEAGIPGVAGIVKDGIMPGYFAYEAGQSCVGDHYAWFTKNCVPVSYAKEAEEKGISVHQLLTQKLEGYKAGQSGLIALDWFNGVRSPLMDFNLNGLLMGMNLLTKPEEIYLALIEATAYGTRMIIESFEQAGVPVNNIVLSGGIPLKNKMLVQVYSDICNREIKICGSSNASARGAAILGAAAADESVTGYKNANEAAADLGKIDDVVYRPNPENVAVYDKLYAEYKTLLDYFGRGANDVMKRLNAIRDEQM